MKKIFLSLILLICFNSANAQSPSNCIVSNILQTNYDADVKHLALQRIFNQNISYKDSIKVSQNYQDTIWAGLAAIFNLSSNIERDSVFDNYCIHHDASNFIYHNIYVKVDVSYSWTQQWQNLNTNTGITALDNLLSVYGFSITNFSTFVNVATLSTTQNINVIPLCDSIATFAGVQYSEPKSLIGSGNEITYNTIGTDRYYNFSVGYGDCPSGCIGKHTFKYKVYANCSVDYLGKEDLIDPSTSIPAPPNCNITTSMENMEKNMPFTIFPNPVKNIITITQTEKLFTTYEIYSLNGTLITENKIDSTNQKVDLSSYSKGMYLVKLIGKEKTIFKKVVLIN